jgi:4'-phosphopantetheinyl transferase
MLSRHTARCGRNPLEERGVANYPEGMSTDVAIRWLRTPLSPEQRLRSLAQLTDAERTREPTDAFLAGRLLLRDVAREVLGREPEITATCPDCGAAHGQPRLDGLFASIAHADGLVIVAVSTESPVGVDVEPNDAEVPEAVAGGATVRHWTGVEAVLKADGRGLRVDPREVRIAGSAASVDGVDYLLDYPETVPGFTIAVARAVPAT